MIEAVRPLDAASISPLTRFFRRRLLQQLRSLRCGCLTLHDALGTTEMGEGGSLRATVVVHDMAVYRSIALQGTVGAGDTYGEGSWSCNDLVALVRLLVRNRDLMDGMEKGFARLGAVLLRGWHASRRNTQTGSRKNIAAHYDLGNEFFAAFLSKDMMYSSALWKRDGETLEQASTRKLDWICRKLDLGPGQEVLEIGTGWGGFAIHAAERYGCRVITTTLSREQHAFARRRVRERNLDPLIRVLCRDYRDLDGQYDKLVCIEMIEAIGAEYLPGYFAKVAALLVPGGRALLQAITIEDHRYQLALRSVDFIKRFIFPGSFIPSVNALLAAKTAASDLALVQLEDFGPSYARTMQAWRARFLSARDQIRAQGYDERLLRLWEFYLAYCEGGFEERSIGVSHLLFEKPGFA